MHSFHRFVESNRAALLMIILGYVMYHVITRRLNNHMTPGGQNVPEESTISFTILSNLFICKIFITKELWKVHSVRKHLNPFKNRPILNFLSMSGVLENLNTSTSFNNQDFQPSLSSISVFILYKSMQFSTLNTQALNGSIKGLQLPKAAKFFVVNHYARFRVDGSTMPWNT